MKKWEGSGKYFTQKIVSLKIFKKINQTENLKNILIILVIW